MESGTYGLTRGTCFVARRLEVLAVAGLLFDYFMMCFSCGGISFFYFAFFFERTRPGASVRPPSLIYRSSGNDERMRVSNIDGDKENWDTVRVA